MASADDGHRYRFGPPTSGWPTFDENGKLVTADFLPTDEEPDDWFIELEDETRIPIVRDPTCPLNKFYLMYRPDDGG